MPSHLKQAAPRPRSYGTAPQETQCGGSCYIDPVDPGFRGSQNAGTKYPSSSSPAELPHTFSYTRPEDKQIVSIFLPVKNLLTND